MNLPDMPSSIPLVALVAPASRWGNNFVSLFTHLQKVGLECVEYWLGGHPGRNEQATAILDELRHRPPMVLLKPESDFLDSDWLHDNLSGESGIALILRHAHEQGIPVVAIAMEWNGAALSTDSLEVMEEPRKVLDRIRRTLTAPSPNGLPFPMTFCDTSELVAMLWLNRRHVAVLSLDRYRALMNRLEQHADDVHIRSLHRFLAGMAVDVSIIHGAVSLPPEFEADPATLHPIKVATGALLFGPDANEEIW